MALAATQYQNLKIFSFSTKYSVIIVSRLVRILIKYTIIGIYSFATRKFLFHIFNRIKITVTSKLTLVAKEQRKYYITRRR